MPWLHSTPVQQESIPLSSEKNRDLIGLAQTGTENCSFWSTYDS